MTTVQVIKALKVCSSDEGCNQCPYQIADPEGHDCAKMVMRDAMSLIMQGELNEGTMNLINEQGELIDELDCWHKLLWKFIHSDKKIDDADLDINELNSGYIKYSAVRPGCEIEVCRDCFTGRDNFLKRNNELDY